MNVIIVEHILPGMAMLSLLLFNTGKMIAILIIAE